MGYARAAWAGLAGVVLFATGTSAVGADDASFVQQVNAIYEGRDRVVPNELRADVIVLTAVAGMDPVPEAARTPLHAALLAPGSAEWGEVEAWALGAAQQGAIEAVRKVGEPGKRFAYLQPYGAGAVDGTLRSKGLYTELGEPPILAAARFLHLDGLDRLACLTQVEATRLAAMGKPNEALTLMVAWTHFARLLADREFAPEVRWGLRNMVIGLERALDVVRVHQEKITDTELGTAIESLNQRNLGLDRLRLPKGARIAGEQIVARAFEERGGASGSRFGATMALVTSSERPLLQFGEAARWQDAAVGHAGTFDTGDSLRGVFKDFELRWGLRQDDRILETPSDYARLDKTRYSVVAQVAEPFPSLFTARQRVAAEAAGARMALAAAAFRNRYNTFPVALSAARPAYIKTVEKDTYTTNGTEFHYFVPIRDQPRGERELPKPHTVRVGGSDVAEQPPVIPEHITLETLRGALEVVAPQEEAEQKFERAIEQSRFDRTKLGTILKEYFSAVVGPTVGAVLGEPSFWGEIWNPASSSVPTEEALYTLFLATMHKKLKEKDQLRQAYEELVKLRPPASPSGLGERGDVALGGAKTFSVAFDDSTFVLYSSGPNGVREWAREVGHAGADLLIWPPMITLLRERVAKGEVSAGELTGPWALHDLIPLPEPKPASAAPAEGAKPAEEEAPSGPVGPRLK
ncbi:MAG: hypothetical protein AB7G17_00245 [Phycisphaerales bacterium]